MSNAKGVPEKVSLPTSVNPEHIWPEYTWIDVTTLAELSDGYQVYIRGVKKYEKH